MLLEWFLAMSSNAFFAFVPISLLLHAPGYGVTLSPPEPRAFGKHLRYAFRGKFRNSRFALRHLNFLSPAFAFLEPEVRIGGDRATPQPVACSALAVSLGLSHSKWG
jgi:hypothetical protein